MSFYHALKLFRRLYIRLKLWCHWWFKSAFYKQYFCNLTACITGQNGAVKSIMEIYLLFKVTANHIGFCIAWVDFTHPKIFAVFRRGVNSVSPGINHRAFAQGIRIHVRNGLVSGSVAKHQRGQVFYGSDFWNMVCGPAAKVCRNQQDICPLAYLFP